MNKFIYLLFLAIFFLEYLHSKVGIIPRSLTWIPDIFSIMAYLIILARLAQAKKINIHKKYIYMICLYFFIALLGIVINKVPVQSIIVGLRFYFKTIPFFLLPAVFNFSSEQFKKQLFFILPLLLIQCPIALYQRVFQLGIGHSGDFIYGTLCVSSVLSMTMICSIAVVVGFLLKKEVNIKTFILITLCLFLPTTINETKGSLIMIPIATMFPLLLFYKTGIEKIKKILPMLLLSIIFFGIFFSLYDYYYKSQAGGGTLFQFLESKNNINRYLFYEPPDGQDKAVGRGAAIRNAYTELSEDFVKFTFGLGLGNVIETYFASAQGDQSTKRRSGATVLTFTNIFWELGALGIAIYITFFIFIYRDVVSIIQQNNIFSSFAVGWSAVTVMIGLSMFYKNIIQFDVINYLFWYFSGILVVKKQEMKIIPNLFSLKKLHPNRLNSTQTSLK